MSVNARLWWTNGGRQLTMLTIASVLLVWAGRVVMPWEKMFPDVVCFWGAATVLASGENPYDPGLQRSVQAEHGWDRGEHGFGIYDFLPYFYPPWFGLLWMPLLPLGYSSARLAWFFLNVEMILGAGYLLGRRIGRFQGLTVVLTPAFFFSLACISLGQTAIVVLFLSVLSWTLLDQRRDAAAGVALAWLTLKPQLTIVLLLGLLLWAVRQRRWRVVVSFALSVGVLAGVSTAFYPAWLPAMLRAPAETVAPTEYYPWIGNAWFLVLRAVGVQGGARWALYLLVALPYLGIVVRTSLRAGPQLANLFSLSLLAAFFVAPYARHYDFPVLLIPLLVLAAQRLPTLAGIALLGIVLVTPYIQLSLLADLKPTYHPSVKFLLESTFFWLPVLLSVLWAITSVWQRSTTGEPGGGPTLPHAVV